MGRDPVYDMSSEWDRYMTRYEGYAPATLDEFVDRGIATYDPEADSYTITPGEGEPFTVRNTFGDGGM